MCDQTSEWLHEIKVSKGINPGLQIRLTQIGKGFLEEICWLGSQRRHEKPVRKTGVEQVLCYTISDYKHSSNEAALTWSWNGCSAQRPPSPDTGL